jgi:hypothetical protein
LIDLQQDVHLHWVSSSIRHLTLRESLEQFLLDPKLQPFYGDAAHRRICPRRTDRFWLRQTLFSALTGPAFPAARTLAGV